MRVKMILPALTEATSPFFRPIKYSLFPPLGLATLAAYLDPDILLLDEVLAVGDAEFQAKCIERINQLRKAGTTIVFVSHNLAAVEGICDRVFLLRQGEIFRSGLPRYVISEYEHMLTNMPASAPARLTGTVESPAAQIISVASFNSDGRNTTMFATGDEARIEVEYIAHEPVEDAVIEIYFYSIWGDLHTHFSTDVDGKRLDLVPGPGLIEFICPDLSFEAATFNIETSIRRRGSSLSEHLDYKQAGVINISKGKAVHGAFHSPHSWRMKNVERQESADADAVVKNAD